MSTRPPADQPHLAEEALEAQLLTHFRQHSQGEPSAELDARILAAATAEVRHVKPALGAWQDWFKRLLAPSGMAALAGVACVGLAISLTWRTLQEPAAQMPLEVSQPMSAPTPEPLPAAASAPAPVTEETAAFSDSLPAADSSMASSSTANRAMAKREAPFAAQRSAERTAAAPAASAPAKKSLLLPAAPPVQIMAAPAAASSEELAKAKSPAPSLEGSLRQLRQLRESGQQDAAAALLAELQQRYPQRDIEAELLRLPR